MIYEQGANAVFLFGSTLRDPATAHDLDFLVSGLTYEGRTRVEYQDDRLYKDTDICLFDLDCAAQRPFVAHNLPGSYHISRDGALSVATTWLLHPCASTKPCFSDEIKQHLEAVDRRLASVEMEKTTTLVSALRFMQHTLWAIARYDGPNHLGLFPSTVFMWRIMDYCPT